MKIAQQVSTQQVNSASDFEETLSSFVEDFLDDDLADDLEEVSFFELDEDKMMDQADSEQMPFRLPGATDYVKEPEQLEEESGEPAKEATTWEDDRDVNHFMEYIVGKYPSSIPSHDGTTTTGCERAVVFLTNLNKEISEALRKDHKDVLDIGILEKIRVNITKDIITLKDHIKHLNKKRKKAGEETSAIVKEAKSADFQMVITPFERAVTGMIVNSVVSAGKDFQEVYETLKEKYKFSDREELSIIQILMDMGYPMFKDRGTVGEADSKAGGDGVDFMKNYFA